MLLCGIVEDLEQNPQSENLGYFFCQATDYRINTAAAVVGGLIKSLLKGHPRLVSRVRDNYEDKLKDQLDGANGLVILCDIFETIINDLELTDVICVVDALDECIKDCSHLLNLIIKTSGHVKWLLSSRNEKDIEKMLDQVPQKLILELKQNAERISTSIDAYIRHHIHEIEALKDDEQLQAKTLDILKSKAQGTFLWVALVVEQLHKTDHWDVENVLEEVPKDLESLYGLILDRTEKLGKRGQEVCQVLLSTVTTAKRPLHLRELLVFINSHWKDSRYFRTIYELRDIRDMAKTCGSILSIRDDTVYFIHQSAKDYLVENATQRIFPILQQHCKMFEASLDAMSNILEYDMYGLEDPGIHIDDVPPKDIDSDPLASIRYCCVFWIEHLISGYQYEGFEDQKYLKDNEKLHSFLKEKFLGWIEALCLMRNFNPLARTVFQKLKNLIKSYCGSGSVEGKISPATQLRRENETRLLTKFTDDAYQFVVYSTESLAYWPLQLYFSATIFEEGKSTIRKTFEKTVRRKFGPSPTLVSERPGQSSRLQNFFRIDNDYVSNYGVNSSKWLGFSPDSSLIGQVRAERGEWELRFWRADSGNLERTFPIDSNSKITFFPDTNDFIAVSYDGKMAGWSMNRKSCIVERSLKLRFRDPSPSPPSPPRADVYPRGTNIPTKRFIALSPKGDLVASWTSYPPPKRCFLGIWCIDWSGIINSCVISGCVTHRRLDWARECGGTSMSHQAPPIYAVFSPNSLLLALSFSDSIEIRNAMTGKVFQYLDSYGGKTKTHDPCIDFNQEDHFSPNSKFLVTIGSQQQLCLWDTHTWELLRKIEVSSHPLVDNLDCLAISPDSVIIATSLFDGIKLWSSDTGECVAKISSRSLSMTFAPDWTKSSHMVLRTYDDIIQTWSVDVKQTISDVQNLDYTFDDVTISPDSSFVVSKRSGHSEIHVWRGDDGRLVHVLKAGSIGMGLYVPTFSPDSELLAYDSDRLHTGIQIWVVSTGKPLCLLERQSSQAVSSVAFSRDPKHLVAGTTNGEIYIWYIDSSQLIYNYDIGNQSQELHGAALVTISQESSHVVALWDSGKKIRGQIRHLQKDKKVAITPSRKDWAWKTRGNPFPTFLDKAKISFSSDSEILVFISASVAQIFDVDTGTCLLSFAIDGDEKLRLTSFDPFKNRILTAKSVFFKASSWKHWQTLPRLGYSYSHPRSNGSATKSDAWIILNGKKRYYVPRNFRPALRSDRFADMAMTDSLLAIVNEVREVVIIKFPTQRETRQQATGDFDVGPTLQGTAGNADDSYSVAQASATSDSDLSSAKRKRRECDEPGIATRRIPFGQ
ncbi:hypothetical protein H0G86_004635 [Trichoderma simmonsii]|uniref:NACHT domain-containing protein n=1 Tax=Trichoderma simmonsii TaxID=1491479 RepID=A0A8G0LAV9_9HYPO|nr:hypothetical protein H0G86_004635 [Trichoderma simmonsii]